MAYIDRLKKTLVRLSAMAVVSAVAACGGSGGATYSVGGQAAGVIGAGLVLRNNGGDSLSVPASGSFASGSAWPRVRPMR